MLITNAKILLLEENGSFPEDHPISAYMLQFPGLGFQPDYCCSVSSEKSQITDFDFSCNPGAPTGGHHNCNLASCPECYKHWVLTETWYALARLEAVKAAHPESRIYHLKYAFREQNAVTRKDIGSARKSLKRVINKAEGVYGGVDITHHNKIKPHVEERIKKQHIVDFGYSPTRTQLYRLASDLAYLWHCGFTFKDWREAFDTFWHFHVYVVADHYPSELYIHGNQKKPLSKFLIGGPVPKKNFYNTREQLSTKPTTTRPDGTPYNWRHAKVADYTDPYDGPDLARSLYYCYSHATISAFKSLEIRVLHPIGACNNLHLDFIHDQPTEEEIEDPITGNTTLTTIYPDPRVTTAYETLKTAFSDIHRSGEWIFPGEEKAPKINEGLKRTKRYVPPLLRISARIFQLRTVYKDGQRIPADGSEFTYKRRDTFIKMIQDGEAVGIIPIFPVKLSDSIRKAFEKWDERCLNPKLRAKERLLYSADFEGFEDFKKAGWTIDLGFISKAAAYRFPDSLEIDKFKALEVAFYASLDSDNFLEDFTNAMETLVPRYTEMRLHRLEEPEEIEALTTQKNLSDYFMEFELMTTPKSTKPIRKHQHINPKSAKAKKRLKEQAEFNDLLRREGKLTPIPDHIRDTWRSYGVDFTEE